MTPKLGEAIARAYLEAQRPDVEVRLTFDDVDDAEEGIERLVSTLDRVGLYDERKSTAAAKVTSNDKDRCSTLIELRNGSCIRLLWANRVWTGTQWVRLLKRPAAAAKPPGP